MLIYVLTYAFAKLNHTLFTVVLHYLLTLLRSPICIVRINVT